MHKKEKLTMRVETDKDIIEAFKRDLESNAISDDPVFDICLFEDPPSGCTIKGLSIVSHSLEKFQDLVQMLFDLSLTHRITQLTRVCSYDLMFLGNSELQKERTPIGGYKFYLERSKDNESNITPEFMEALFNLATQIIRLRMRHL